MDISLTPELERRLAETVAAGRYVDPSEVVRASLQRLFDAEDEAAKLRDQVDAMIQVGLDQLDRGESIGADEFRRRLATRFGRLEG